MADILGIKLPKSKTGQALAGIAIVSIPLAAVLGIGLGVRAAYRKLRPKPETDEERCARMERIAHLDGVYDEDAQ